MLFISFPFLGLPNYIDRCGKSSDHCLAPDIRGKAYNLVSLSMICSGLVIYYLMSLLVTGLLDFSLPIFLSNSILIGCMFLEINRFF